MTGYSLSAATAYDYATIKYDTLGNELWVARYDGQASAYDLASAIALDSVGNVFVTGFSSGAGKTSITQRLSTIRTETKYGLPVTMVRDIWATMRPRSPSFLGQCSRHWP